MKKLLLVIISIFLVGCSTPTELETMKELDDIEVMLSLVNDNDVPVAIAPATPATGTRSIRRKPSFGRVIHRLKTYLQNHEVTLNTFILHEEATGYLVTAKNNLVILRQMKKDGKAGTPEFRRIVRETRQLLRKTITNIRKIERIQIGDPGTTPPDPDTP